MPEKNTRENTLISLPSGAGQCVRESALGIRLRSHRMAFLHTGCYLPIPISSCPLAYCAIRLLLYPWFLPFLARLLRRGILEKLSQPRCPAPHVTFIGGVFPLVTKGHTFISVKLKVKYQEPAVHEPAVQEPVSRRARTRR